MNKFLEQIRSVILPSGVDYFQMFTIGAEISLRAAQSLQIAFTDLAINVDELHKIKEIEHEGDRHVTASLKILEDAFITPIDQADLIDILKAIENVTDHIDYVAAHLYMLNINESDHYLQAFIDTMVLSCRKVLELMICLRNFKKLDLKTMYRLIDDVNELEEIADRIYLESMRDLFTGGNDPLVIIQKKEIYQRLEDVLDCTEDAANAVKKILIAKL
ncbi:MAG: DUF47 family protein [Erysipelotrichales bacterium]|nr:MAG: DUF47 family protein [Erysipelotrichales bacterium]